jgi:hypothetical protein
MHQAKSPLLIASQLARLRLILPSQLPNGDLYQAMFRSSQTADHAKLTWYSANRENLVDVDIHKIRKAEKKKKKKKERGGFGSADGKSSFRQG